MSVCYALHSLGLGTCLLNWSVDPARDLTLRKRFAIPAYENMITMMAVGLLPETFKVAVSSRVELSQVLRIH
jgi:hypothetical protein